MVHSFLFFSHLLCLPPLWQWRDHWAESGHPCYMHLDLDVTSWRTRKFLLSRSCQKCVTTAAVRRDLKFCSQAAWCFLSPPESINKYVHVCDTCVLMHVVYIHMCAHFEHTLVPLGPTRGSAPRAPNSVMVGARRGTALQEVKQRKH